MFHCVYHLFQSNLQFNSNTSLLNDYERHHVMSVVMLDLVVILIFFRNVHVKRDQNKVLFDI